MFLRCNFVAICALLMLFVAAVSSGIPRDIYKCRNGDSQCLTRSIQMAISQYAKTGIREMNLLPFDPLHINSIKLPKNPGNSVNIELEFKNIDLIGLQQAKVLSVKGLPAEVNGNTEFELLVPRLRLRGPYSIDGSILILPILGKGDADIIIENLHILAKIKAVAYEKNGLTFAEAKAVKLVLNPEHVKFSLSGLFNDNKELGDNMNVFLNENWREIFGEIEPNFSKALGLVIKQILSNVFGKHPYADHFLQ